MAGLLLGSFTLTSSEGFEDFMKALGVGMVMRKMGASATPTVTISEAAGEYTLKTETTFKTTELKFKLGEPVAETTLDGRQAKSTFSLEGSVLSQLQKAEKGPDTTYVRTFTDAGMTMISKVADTECKRVYKRN